MKFKKAIQAQVQSVVSLSSFLNEEEIWAYNNQMDAVKNGLLSEIAWNRGYRKAIGTIANKMDIELHIAD